MVSSWAGAVRDTVADIERHTAGGWLAQLAEFGDGVGDIWHTVSIVIEGYLSHHSTVGQSGALWSFCVVALPR